MPEMSEESIGLSGDQQAAVVMCLVALLEKYGPLTLSAEEIGTYLTSKKGFNLSAKPGGGLTAYMTDETDLAVDA